MEEKNRDCVQHLRSKEVINGLPKLPPISAVSDGEIAVNYASGYETLSIRNSNSGITTFSCDDYYTEKKLGSAFTSDDSATVTQKLTGEYLGVSPNLDEIKETGFYTYTIGDVKYNLVVQTYDTSSQWCVQYQFTANNINRRYYDYVSEFWSEWRTVAVDTYNPNESYIVTAKAIQCGVKDANKEGLYVGDQLNGRYFGISEISLAEMYQEYLDNKLSKLESGVASYDLRKPEGDSQWEVKETQVWVDGGKVKLQNQAYNSGYNTGYGYYIKGGDMIVTPSVLSKVIIEVNSYYDAQDITISGTSGIETIHLERNTSTIIEHESTSDGIILTAPTTYLYIKYVDLVPIVDIKSGDAASLLYNLRHMGDNTHLNIPNGVYNVGNLDEMDIFSTIDTKKGKIFINKNNITLSGSDKNKTVICGQSLEKCGIEKPLMFITGNYVTLENLTLSATLLPSINGQLPAIITEGKDVVVNNCNIIGGQDTIWIRNNSSLWLNSTIEGTVDFVCGGNLDKLAYFYRCDIQIKNRSVSNVICAPTGFITFKNCRINKNDAYEYDMNDNYYLARPWGNGSVVFYINTHFFIECLGYTTMSEGTNFGYYGDEGNTDILWHPIPSWHDIDKTSSYYSKIVDKASIVQQFDNQARINGYDFN